MVTADALDSQEKKILVIIACGTNNPNRSVRGLHLAQLAHKMGKPTAVFLLDEAVYLSRKGVTDHLMSPTGDIADDLIAYLQEFDIPIYVCGPCALTRQILEEDLMEGFQLALAEKLIELACQSQTISL